MPSPDEGENGFVPNSAEDDAERGAPAEERQLELRGYARSTWRSFEQLVVPSTGLPADHIDGQLRPATRAAYTSPTNIAMTLWATLAARDLELISPASATRRLQRVLDSLAALERHEASGQFYNWYHPATLDKLTLWPEAPGGPVHPFLSSVDNGWLASALIMVSNAMPALRDEAWRLATSMDFGSYHDPLAKGSGPGLLRGGFWRLADAPPGSEAFPRGDYSAMGETVVYTGHHYGAFNTEVRIASYVGIALGQLPPEHYFAGWRTVPEDGAARAQGTKPVGTWRRYLGVDVFEGAQVHGDRRIVPSWGGSMFEALMPALVVPEKRWGPKSWAVNHPLYVEAQIEFGLGKAGHGYWGFSPASDPAGGYREYGVAALGLARAGYGVAEQGLMPVEPARANAARANAARRRTAPVADGAAVVTPHAAFLALAFAPDAALANLRALRRDFPDIYGPGGFKDAVNVATGQVADRYLALDQGMVMAALANALLGDRLQAYLAETFEPTLAPLMAMEEFAAGRVASEPEPLRAP